MGRASNKVAPDRFAAAASFVARGGKGRAGDAARTDVENAVIDPYRVLEPSQAPGYDGERAQCDLILHAQTAMRRCAAVRCADEGAKCKKY